MILLTILMFLPQACKRKDEPEIGKIKVVVTIPPLADFSRQIGGERIKVVTLLSPGTSPHTFEPTPSLAKAAEEADLIVRIGLDVDHWMDGLIPDNVPVITGGHLDGIILIHEDSKDGQKNEISHTHSAEGANPHIWLDPFNAKIISSEIADELVKIDPEGKKIYITNRRIFLARLDTLDSEIREAFSELPSRKYISFHPAWIYFAARYGLERINVIMQAPGKEPSPKSLKEVIEDIKENGARMVFAEPQFSPKAAEIIAEEADVPVLFLDPLGKPGETYIDLMERNIKVFIQALGEM